METKKHFKLSDIEAYRSALKLSNYVWEIVFVWPNFQRDTVGKQFARAVDSVSANIAEGFGRYSKKDKINSYRYARASVYECLDWNQKAKARELISLEQYKHNFQELQTLPKLINGLIKITNDNLAK